VKRPVGSNTRTLAEYETIESGGHSDPNVDILTYPKSIVVATWNRSGTVYRATRSLSNLWMNVGGVARNVMRYRNVNGVPTATLTKRG
jgi:hypothetical protein